MPIYIKDYHIQASKSVSKQEPIHQQETNSSKTILSLNAAAYETMNSLSNITTLKTSILNAENVSASKPVENGTGASGNILNNNTNTITNLINTSLVDMKNSMNIQEANSLKRKSPINDEDLAKS